MLSVKSFIRNSLIGCLILAMTMSSLAIEYIPTAIDTSKAPTAHVYEVADPDEFELLYETSNLKYYYKQDRDIIGVLDKRSGYMWKTGIDIPFNREVEDLSQENLDAGISNEGLSVETRLNTTYTAFANSLVTVEYYDEANNIKRSSSASLNGRPSALNKITDNHYRLDISFNEIGINLKLQIYFDEKGIAYEIKDEDITGVDVPKMAAILISPFLGSTGGQRMAWNEDEQDFTTPIINPIIPGYVLVPDGSGALIRFKDNSTSLRPYVGDVFGVDISQQTYHSTFEEIYTPFKNPLMPVFGIAHGDKQNAFVAFAESGAEYMEIVVTPEENMTFYTYAYPRFVYNSIYYQIYNQRGSGYFTTFDERNHFDLKVRYNFLAGDGSTGEAADYSGMALSYKNYLIENEQLNVLTDTNQDIPVRLDFIMSDVKNSILGTEQVIMTTTEQLDKILEDVKTLNISNINSGLLGWQKGGITLGKPWKASFTGKIGSGRDFQKLVDKYEQEGIDISFSQDYTMINKKQVRYIGNAAKHVNNWYNIFGIIAGNVPVTEVSYAKPNKSIEWLEKQTKALNKRGITSLTIEGMTNILLSDYSDKGTTVTDAINSYNKAFDQLGNTYKINAVTPNSYLWGSVDRFLQSPVFSTQHIIETDTVPFLQMILNGSMEVYAPYSNFSFYTDSDILRMIDYNIYPSFVLTEESSHLLATTNSSKYYSTEYRLYKDVIDKIYHTVNDALRNTLNDTWVSRDVIENGLIVNTYESGLKIAINYSENKMTYSGVTIQPLSYAVIQN